MREGGVMQKLYRDSKGRFVSVYFFARIRLKYMIQKLEKGEWYAEVSGIKHSPGFFRDVARLYRLFRIKHKIYETF